MFKAGFLKKIYGENAFGITIHFPSLFVFQKETDPLVTFLIS